MIYDPNLIVTDDNRRAVMNHLVSVGYHPATVESLSSVQLANAYHSQPPDATPTDLQRLAANIVATVLQAMGPSIDMEAVRRLVRDEVDALAPRRLEVVSPRGSVTIDGLRHYMTEDVIQTVALGHPVMMVGPAGCGKTTIGEHAAQALKLPFYITNTINDTHELMGFVDGHGKYHDTPFRTAFEHGGLWIADEIDAWDASALLAANSALANGYASFPDRPERVSRHNDFRMVATANTFGTGADRVYVGRNELDAASLDRFAVIEVDYDLDLEREFANGNDRWLDHVWNVRKQVVDKRIRHVVSSRAIRMGSDALTAGIAWDKCEVRYLFKGMSSKDRGKIDA